MSQPLEVSLQLVDQKVHFRGQLRTLEPVHIDYRPPLGTGSGYTSLELLLMSLSSCVGSTTLWLLRKSGKSIESLEVKAQGLRREQHPTGFERIDLDFVLRSPDISVEEFQLVLREGEAKYCPVWSMLRGNTTITTRLRLNEQT